MAEKEKAGYVYILTNPSMPDWIKIGSAKNVEERLRSLNSKTAVPLSFSCYARLFYKDYEFLEQKIHALIDSISPGLRAKERTVSGGERVREFFRMSPASAVGVFKQLMEILDIPSSYLRFDDSSPEEIQEESTRRRKNSTFEMLGIPVGSELIFVKDESIKVQTADNKNRVIFNGQEENISALAGRLLERPSGTANGFEWFRFGDSPSLWDRRQELERQQVD